ncbi:MAG: crotonase/enoyl-CoA hydratase family protein [Nevskia sp.]|nr:crotonase/enoyl-CoA hydratase family protein [Nevskia sp.]
MQERVRLQIENGIARVALARAEKYNGLDWNMLQELVRAARTVRGDRSVRAVILYGEGKAFSAGLDFKAFGKQPLHALRGFLKYGVKSTNLFQQACWCWRELPVPVIAALHGKCYGGGFQIALAADFRIATPDCECSIMESKWGLVPDMTGTVTLRELVPIDVAKQLTMTGRLFSGAEAKQMNLVTQLADDPLAAAETLAQELMTRSPDAVAATKSLFHRTWLESPARAFDIESRLQSRLLLGANQRIAMRANFAGKKPVFRKRRFDP